VDFTGVQIKFFLGNIRRSFALGYWGLTGDKPLKFWLHNSCTIVPEQALFARQ
jgi:hypothetical protein